MYFICIFKSADALVAKITFLSSAATRRFSSRSVVLLSSIIVTTTSYVTPVPCLAV